MATEFGCWLDIPSASVAEILANAGFDWLLIDMEHGAIGIETVTHCLMALKGTSTKGYVRVAEGTEAAIKRALDTGADAVMVPNVRSAKEARALARFFHYAPLGARGQAQRIIRASRWGRDADSYGANWPRDHKLILQIETPEALAEVEQIAQVEGVDMLFLGPADLAASSGVPTDDISLRDAASRIAKVARAHGLRAGCVLYAGAGVADLLECGMTDLSVAGDVAMLNASADAALATARAAADA